MIVFTGDLTIWEKGVFIYFRKEGRKKLIKGKNIMELILNFIKKANQLRKKLNFRVFVLR